MPLVVPSTQKRPRPRASKTSIGRRGSRTRPCAAKTKAAPKAHTPRSDISRKAAGGTAPMSRSRRMPPPTPVTAASEPRPTTSICFSTACKAPETANAKTPTSTKALCARSSHLSTAGNVNPQCRQTSSTPRRSVWERTVMMKVRQAEPGGPYGRHGEGNRGRP